MTTEPEQDATGSPTLHPAGRVGYLLALTAAVLMLYMLTLGFEGMQCVWILPIAVVIALPLWRYQTDRLLFERRAILATVATPTGRLWHWFWRGRLSSIVQVFVALAFAIVLLAMLSPMQPLHWAVLVADAILMALVIPPVRRMLAGQVKDRYIGLVARRWPLTAINVLLVVIGFVYVDYAVLGWPDTRSLPWPEVAGRAFSIGQEGVACGVAGVCLGIANTVAAVSRHAASLVIPSLPSVSVRIVAWFVFLAWTGFGAFLFTRLLLGVVALLDRAGTTEAGQDDRTTRAFVYTILVLAVPYLYANIKIAEWQAGPVALPAPAPIPVPAADPCRGFQFDAAGLSQTLNKDVAQARTQAHRLAEERIDAALDQAFGKAANGVDKYLDWYYSLVGDYSRLAAVVTGDIDQLMSDQLSRFVVDETGFESILESSSGTIEKETMLIMERSAAAVSAAANDAVRRSPCPVPTVDLDGLTYLERDKLRATIATAAGGAVTAKFLLKKPAAAMAGKLAAKGTVKAAGKVLGKAAVKKGASVASTAVGAGTATAACAPLGPFAIACGIGAGVAIWFTVDKVVLEIDEWVNRDEMRAELLTGLAEQRAETREYLVRLHHQLVDMYAVEIDAQVGKVFVPQRDGT